MLKKCILILIVFLFLMEQGDCQIFNDIASIKELSSHRSSSHDTTGGNADNVTSFAPSQSHILFDVNGSGRINHIWITVSNFRNHKTFLRDLVIKMYWEHSKIPFVEVPLGDFFALGHGKLYQVKSLPIAVGNNSRALNCYWPMPFYRYARIEIYNNGERSIRRIYYNIDYELGDIPKNQGLFHAVYNRDKELKGQINRKNIDGKENYVILKTEGKGHYVGCAFFVDAQKGGWWGEGDEMIFIDDNKLPEIIGTGSEDYFCNAWGFNTAFCYPLPKSAQNHLKSYAVEEVRQDYNMDGVELEQSLRSKGLKARAITTGYSTTKNGGWLKIDDVDGVLEIPIQINDNGTFHVQVRLFHDIIEDSILIGSDKNNLQEIKKFEGNYRDVPYVDLGQIKTQDKKLKFFVGDNKIIGIDHILIEKIE